MSKPITLIFSSDVSDEVRTTTITMPMLEDSTSIAHLIQLAVAPVFLLAGIAGFLSVMSGRIGRIIDRERVISRRLTKLDNEEHLQAAHREHTVLKKRAHITNLAIGLCTSSALVVCTLITSLFVGDLFKLHMEVLVIALFVIAMLLLIAALVLFLVEIRLATRTLNLAQESGSD